MSESFDDVVLEWGGESYTVPATRVLPLICQIEDALCPRPGDSAVAVLVGKPPVGRLALAYEAALRFAGAPVAPGEVYLSIMEDLAEGGAEHVTRTRDAVLQLLALVAPPVHRRVIGATAGKKPQTAGSSETSTGYSSAKDG